MTMMSVVKKLRFRMYDWVVATAVLLAIVAYVAPEQLGLIVYKMLLVSIAAAMAYWVDYSLYRQLKQRLDESLTPDIFGAMRILSRALIFIGVVLGVTQGL